MLMSRRRFVRALTAAGVANACPALGWAAARHTLRIGISAETLPEVNLNDARAAYHIWTQEIIRNLDLSIELLPEIFAPSPQMVQMIRHGLLDGFAITGREFARTQEYIDPSVLSVGVDETAGVEYLLVTRREAGYRRVEELRGRQIGIHRGCFGALLHEWLTLLLHEQGLGTPRRFFAEEVSSANLNQVILPVFFGRLPAAALSRNAYETAVELNPQLGRELQVLATSPRVIPTLFAFRRGCDPADLQQMRRAVQKLQASPTGQQLLQIYHSRGYVEKPVSIMAGTLAMMREYDRAQAHSGQAR